MKRMPTPQIQRFADKVNGLSITVSDLIGTVYCKTSKDVNGHVVESLLKRDRTRVHKDVQAALELIPDECIRTGEYRDALNRLANAIETLDAHLIELTLNRLMRLLVNDLVHEITYRRS